MAKKYIKIFDDTILKQTINQGTEDQRTAATLGTFSMGELAYTRDTGRVFVGDCGNKDEGSQETVGGGIVGNKYLGMVDSAPLAYNIDSEHYDKNYDEATRHYPVYDEYSDVDKALLESGSRYRITGSTETGDWSNWSREAEYNTKYNAYNGDFMYDAAQNALILFDKNIQMASSESACVQVKEYIDPDGKTTRYVQYYDKDGNQLSTFDEETKLVTLNETVEKDAVKHRTPFVNYNNGEDEEGIENPSTPNPKVFGDGYVVFRNIEPDNDTISFVKKAFNTNGASVGEDKSNPGNLTDNNYSHNLLSVVKVYGQAMDAAMDTAYFTRDGSDTWKFNFSCLSEAESMGNSDGPFTIKANPLIIKGTDTINIGNISYNFKGDKEEYADGRYEFVLQNDDYNSYDVHIARKSVTKYYINLGNGLSSRTGANYIMLDNSATTLSDSAPAITLDAGGLGSFSKIEEPLFVAWTRTDAPVTDIDNYTAIFDLVVDPNYTAATADGTVYTLYTLNKSIITDSSSITYKDWFTENNKATDSVALRSSYEMFGVAGNNNVATLTLDKIENTAVVIDYNKVTEESVDNHPISSAEPTVCASNNIIGIDGISYVGNPTAWAEARAAIDNAIATGSNLLYKDDTISLTPIFEYTYTEDPVYGKYYSLGSYFYSYDTLYVDDNIPVEEKYDYDYIDGALELVFKAYGASTDLEYTDVDLFYDKSTGKRKPVSEVFSGIAEGKQTQIARGIYATWNKNVVSSPGIEDKVQYIAKVVVTSEAFNLYHTTSENKYFLNKAAAKAYYYDGADNKIPASDEYNFPINSAYEVSDHLPAIAKDEVEGEDTIYYLEDSNVEIKAYTVITGSTITVKNLDDVCADTVLNGQDKLPSNFSPTAIVIYTAVGAYVYYIKKASYLLTVQKPGERKTKLYIDGSWTSKNVTLSEALPESYKFKSNMSALLLEVNHTTDEHIEIYASSNIYKLKGANTTIFGTGLKSSQLGDKTSFVEDDEKYILEDSVYTYNIPGVKPNDEQYYNLYMPIGEEVNIFSSYGQTTGVIELPLTSTAGIDGNCGSLRIVGLKPSTELSIRAIGYR